MVLLSIATAGLAAFLAFAIEPLVGRLLLPTYGGAAAVWTTALVFFQGALLLGYATAHVVIRVLGVRRAAFVEVGLVGVALLALPVALPAAAAPPPGSEPVIWLVGVLAVTVGAPFVALATATPTLQQWIAAAGDSQARGGAFRLFGASNLGSLAGLLAYPVLVEPNLDLDAQARLWTFGYVAFVAAIGIGAVQLARRTPGREERLPADGPRPSGRVRLGWLALAAIPAGLVVGTTAQLTIDVAAVPLLWVGPLAVYLLTFVLAFAGPRPIGLRWADLLLPPLALGLVLTLFAGLSVPLWLTFTVALGSLGCAGLVCHGRLALARPIPERLTEFDLAIAAGGALGGLLTGIVAPLVLPIPIEGALALALALAVRRGSRSSDPAEPAEGGRGTRPARAPLGLGARHDAVPPALRRGCGRRRRRSGLAGHRPRSGRDPRGSRARAPARARALAGRVRRRVRARRRPGAPARPAVADERPHVLRRATRRRGRCRTTWAPERDHDPGHPALPRGRAPARADRLLPSPGAPSRTWSRRSRTWPNAQFPGCRTRRGCTRRPRPADRFADLLRDRSGGRDRPRDPRLFTYLADALAPVAIVVGDGRLGLASTAAAGSDLIVIDAFNSDAVPVHLIKLAAALSA